MLSWRHVACDASDKDPLVMSLNTASSWESLGVEPMIWEGGVVVVVGPGSVVVVVVVGGAACPLAMTTIKRTTRTATMIRERRCWAKNGGMLNDGIDGMERWGLAGLDPWC